MTTPLMGENDPVPPPTAEQVAEWTAEREKRGAAIRLENEQNRIAEMVLVKRRAAWWRVWMPRFGAIGVFVPGAVLFVCAAAGWMNAIAMWLWGVWIITYLAHKVYKLEVSKDATSDST